MAAIKEDTQPSTKPAEDSVNGDTPDQLSQEPLATEDMCAFCFRVLIHHLSPRKDDAGRTEEVPAALFPDYFCPLFVSWKKFSGRNNQRLRGCIGTLSSKAIRTALRDYTLSSALRDPRFEPISMSEIDRLTVSVNLLTKYEYGRNWLDWEVGTHGIIIDFDDPYQQTNKYCATYLPDVAEEQGWSRDEAIQSLIRKAGFNGQINNSILEGIRLTRYQSSIKHMSYPEFELYCKQHN